MPNVYVRQVDRPTWAAAERLAYQQGESLSQLIIRVLAREVAQPTDVTLEGLTKRIAELEGGWTQLVIRVRDIEGATHRHNGSHTPTYT